MANIRITFTEVTLSTKKNGKCGCGTHRTRSKTFSQTLNPWNKNANGEQKGPDEIKAELREEVKAWKKELIVCDKCKDK